MTDNTNTNYYILSNETDKKIIGKQYPQCKGMPSGLGLTSNWFEQKNSMTKLSNNEVPDFTPDLIFELESDAILTDVISPSNISAKGLLINSRTKQLFDKYEIMDHKYFHATVYFKKTKLDYYWLHFIDIDGLMLKDIDYNLSSFFIADIVFSKIEDIDIQSYEDYLSEKMNLSMQYIRAEKLIFKPMTKSKECDLFYLDQLASKFFISKALKNDIEVNNISGLLIKEQSILR
jgi:hypothetical protein